MECHVRWAATDHPGDPGELHPAERARAEGIRHRLSKDEFVLGRVTARRLVAEGWGLRPADVVFQAMCRRCAGPHGRLEAPTGRGVVHVSVSHSAGLVVVAAALGVRVGVDVERIALRGAAMPVKALSSAEQAVLACTADQQRVPAFIRYWTRKEAVLKATGDGLAVSPATLTVSAPAEPARVLEWVNRPAPDVPVHLSDLDTAAGFLGALATLDRPHTIIG